MAPPTRFAAVVSLLVVGVFFTQSFSLAAGLQTTYVADEVTAETPPELVATNDADVVDLTDHVAGTPELEDPLQTAVETGRFDGSVEPEAHIVLSDVHDDVRFAVYEGRYYRFSLDVSDEPIGAEITLSPTDWRTVAEATADPAADASPEVRKAIDDGSAAQDSFVVSGLYVRDGTYHLVRPESEGAVAGNFFATVGGFLFNPIGWAYVVSGVGLLAALQTRDGPRPVDTRSALAVLPATLAVMWVATTLSGTGSVAMRYALVPFIGVVAAFGLFAGLCLRRRAWGPLAVGSVVLCGVVFAVDVAALGVLGAAFGTLGIVVGWGGSLLLVPYGYLFAVDPDVAATEAPAN
ncbi:hypothetical protein GJR96_10050 [Haloferax sp. MBLA0076]|uniref:Uncharacterized protein n=1 Tax=Haloferax litoreum TaxID=2666140 RepID=A0A6A8GHB6_9EURY|nr:MULTISPECIES: hypothetical protein [Haloferax]KAB1193760.1 hypothetical protein Hfx1148_10015 [Haloferax sp. CBA1148]MRX22296.1 hypothetical protein [Haloferax litoreum]